jgi:hypothetical protein
MALCYEDFNTLSTIMEDIDSAKSTKMKKTKIRVAENVFLL